MNRNEPAVFSQHSRTSGKSPRSRDRRGALLEALEPRMLLSATVSGVTTAKGLNLATFANAPVGATQPDSLAIDGSHVFVGYENGVAKDGSDGLSSTIVEYNALGIVVQTFSVLGHNDGLKVDPATNELWALQNEDANPNLVIIDPTAATKTLITLPPPANGGGYDDITFVNGKTFLSESNPSSNPNTAPAIVEATLSGTTLTTTPILAGDASALDISTHKTVTLNLQDPDSMTSNASGELVMTSQADNELIIVKNPGAATQKVSVLPLSDASKTAVSVDDSLFTSGNSGVVLLTDLTNNAVYEISGSAVRKGLELSAAQDIGQVGTISFTSGRFTPLIKGLGSPRGLAFLQSPAAQGFTVSTFASAPAVASQSDSIAVDGSNVFVGYQNHVAKDGTDGLSSTIVQYNSSGAVVQTYSVLGHNDGIKVDPSTHLVWALQNEDANPNLVIINPTSGTKTSFTFSPPVDGGGFDDITFLNGKVFLSESNPQSNPNTAPAIVEATLSGSTVQVTQVLAGNASAFDQLTHKKVTLNLQDPDSMTSDLSGDLVMTSQADDELVIVKHPGTAAQSVTLVPLSDASKTPVSVDDTLIVPSNSGSVLMTDLNTSTVYQISGTAIKKGLTLSAAPDIGQLGTVKLTNGKFSSVIAGFGSPRGLAFI